VDEFLETFFLCRDEASKKINEGRFVSGEFLADDCYEVSCRKKSTTYELPSLIGFFVYQYAKLRMLQFYFDFLVKHHDFEKFQLIQMDTGESETKQIFKSSQ
jgi:hypothetical protein